MNPEVRRYEHTQVEIAASALAPPLVTYVGPGNRWRLEEAYSYQDGPTRLIVPAGFLFDLASIPRIFWWLIAPFELSVAARFPLPPPGGPPAGNRGAFSALHTARGRPTVPHRHADGGCSGVAPDGCVPGGTRLRVAGLASGVTHECERTRLREAGPLRVSDGLCSTPPEGWSNS